MANKNIRAESVRRKHATPGSVPAWISEHLSYQGTDCLSWPFGKDAYGYGSVRLNGKAVGAHVRILTLTQGPRPSPHHDAAHECGHGHLGCVNPHHLTWKTRSENQLDKTRHQSHGDYRKYKLGPEQVLEIYARANAGELGRVLAEEFKIARCTIYLIKNGKKWASLTGGKKPS